MIRCGVLPSIKVAKAHVFASSPAVALVYTESWPDKGEALRQERLIKKLKKSAKECLVQSQAGEFD